MLNLKSKSPTALEVSLQQWFRDAAYLARCANTVCVVIPEGTETTLQALFGKFYPSVQKFVKDGMIYLKNVVDISVEDLDNQIVEVQNVQHLHDLKVHSMEAV
ncbi:hypothetical protein KASHIRA_01070 [Serratia phage vB_SmaM-Kashira]|nr:hypothetical protein KASHIRA_01070 [Serratia phage vB_SmaM-Kashira]